MTADFVFVTRTSIWGLLTASYRPWSSGKSYKIRYWSTPILHSGCWAELELHANPPCVIEGKDQNPVSEFCRALLSITCNWRCAGLSQWIESGRRSLLEYRCIPRPHRTRYWKPSLKRKISYSLCHACSQICCRESLFVRMLQDHETSILSI